jgi:hypothetical protein
MGLESFISVFRQTVASIAAIPLAVHLPVLVVLLAGAMLCLTGSKLLKPIYVVAMAAVCSVMVGLMAPNFLTDSVAGIPSPLIGVGIGAVLGGVLAIASFRFALGLSSAATFTFAGFLAALTYLSTVPGAIPSVAPQQERITSAWNEQVTSTQEALALEQAKLLVARTKARLKGEAQPELSKEQQEAAATAAANTRGFLDECFNQVHDVWNQLPGDSRVTLLASCVGAAMLGFVLGVVAPVKAGAAITSMAGSLLCVLSGAWLLSLAGIVRPSLLDRGPMIWLAIWGGVALTGFVFQLPRKPHGKHHAEPAAA